MPGQPVLQAGVYVLQLVPLLKAKGTRSSKLIQLSVALLSLLGPSRRPCFLSHFFRFLAPAAVQRTHGTSVVDGGIDVESENAAIRDEIEAFESVEGMTMGAGTILETRRSSTAGPAFGFAHSPSGTTASPLLRHQDQAKAEQSPSKTRETCSRCPGRVPGM